jgi:putative ABC transport system substrate-binding protein
LRELVPQAATLGVLVNPDNPQLPQQMKDIEQASQAMKLPLRVLRATTEDEINAAFDTIAQQWIPGLVIASDPFFSDRGKQIVALAARHAVPAIYPFREDAESGGLMSYGPSNTDLVRQAGNYTGRVLKGEKPADMPILRAIKFEFVINLKTAKTLGLDVPPSLLARADEVIE